MTPNQSADDFISYIEDCVLGAVVSDENREALRTKAEYWFMAGLNKGYIICADQIAEMAKKTLETAAAE